MLHGKQHAHFLDSDDTCLDIDYPRGLASLVQIVNHSLKMEERPGTKKQCSKRIKSGGNPDDMSNTNIHDEAQVSEMVTQSDLINE